MKQIKNPAYVKWAAELRKYSIEVGVCEQIPIDDHRTRLRPYPTNYLTNPKYCDDEQIMQWLAEHPAPAKIIDDPDFVALEARIKQLEEENAQLKVGKNVDMHRLLLEWHEHSDALSIDDVELVVSRYLRHAYYNDTINTVWSVADEDEHLYTDKGLEPPCCFSGSDDDYHMSMLGVYIERFKASRSKTREQRYYECLEEDIKNKLNK